MINPDARFEWRATVWAGLLSGAIVWLFSHGIPWFTSGMVSPTLMGRSLKDPGLVDPAASTGTVLAQVIVGVLYAVIITPLVTRFRGMWAVGLGGLVGLGLYLLNFAVFSFLTVDRTESELPVLITHVVFAAVTAAIYKGLAARRWREKRPAEGI